MQEEIKIYNNTDFLYISAEVPDEIKGDMGKNVRAELPSDVTFAKVMAERGYILGDRTIGVTINLTKVQTDMEKLIRFDVEDGSSEKSRILEIAVAAFGYDRRFNILCLPDEQLARTILSEWVDKLSNVFICRYKGDVLGFIDIEDIDDKTADIHLAAIDQSVRLPGVAMSLYAFAVKKAVEMGKRRLTGRISSRNMAVMNIYSGLGAIFSEPRDIYIKEA